MNRLSLAGAAAILLAAGAALAQTAPTPGAAPGSAPGTTQQAAAPDHDNDAQDRNARDRDDDDRRDSPWHHRRGHWDRDHGHDRGAMFRMMRGMGMRNRMQGAFFHFQNGDSEVTVRCAPDEPMKACVDAAAIMLDKLSAARTNRPAQ